MSAGHSCSSVPAGVSARIVNKFMRDPKLLSLVYRVENVCHDYDLPYLAGYSEDGKTIYIDRHLPEVLNVYEDGRKFSFHPVDFLRVHESWEKALIDCYCWEYEPAHQVATKIEHRAVLAAGIPIHLYDGRGSVLQRYIKADEHEKIEKVPKDLDLTPYKDNKKLFEKLSSLSGRNENKDTKEQAEYERVGTPQEHCGPVQGWGKGKCYYYINPYECQKVAGHISPRGWCKHWKAI